MFGHNKKPDPAKKPVPFPGLVHRGWLEMYLKHRSRAMWYTEVEQNLKKPSHDTTNDDKKEEK